MRSRLERAIDKRDDIRHHIAEWKLGMKPSELRRWERKLEAAEEKVQRLGGYDE